jgi:hypothetical protein
MLIAQAAGWESTALTIASAAVLVSALVVALRAWRNTRGK